MAEEVEANLEAFEEAPAPQTDGPATTGETEVEVQPEAPAEPEHDYLEIDETLGGKYVKMTVDGEEVSVPLNEALQGYSRTQDYTRKTQEVAEMRRQAQEALQVYEALQASPGMTVQILAQRAGVSVEEFLGMTPRQQAAAVEEEQYDDPLERAIHEERQARLALEERLNQRESDEALRRAVGGLKQQFGATDDQARAVVQRAMKLNLDYGAFPMIYQAMAYEAQQQATAQHTAVSEAEVARRRAAAQAASQTVASGGGAANVVPANNSATKFSSIREAIAASLDELEANAR